LTGSIRAYLLGKVAGRWQYSKGFRGPLFGGDCIPEKWPEDDLLMRETGVNRVSLGIFSPARDRIRC
jgi:hypothetical protein